MARKSALEALNQRLEGDGESGDTVIDITVIADSDGEAAEAIEDAIDTGEAEATADAVVEEEEAAQQEQEDMAELAAIVREYGLNAGMAAVINVLVPCASLGISMPAVESLDAAGRNTERAERLAAAFEASGDGFWATTKNFFKRIWVWMRDLCTKVASMIGDLGKRVERMAETLGKREWAQDRNKDTKWKKWKHYDADRSNAYTAIYSELMQVANWKMNSDAGRASMDSDEKRTTQVRTSFKADVLESIGLKWKDANGDNMKLEDVSSFWDTDDVEVDSKLLTSFQKGGDAYKKAIDMANMAKKDLPKWKKTAEDAIKNWESENVDRYGTDRKGDDNENAKKAVKNARAFIGSLQKIVARATKCATFTCTNYLKGGRAVLSHTKPTGSEATYKD